MRNQFDCDHVCFHTTSGPLQRCVVKAIALEAMRSVHSMKLGLVPIPPPSATPSETISAGLIEALIGDDEDDSWGPLPEPLPLVNRKGGAA